MTTEQRRLVWAVCTIVGISYVVVASLTFLITPMLNELGLTADQAGTVLTMPSIASLLIVFAVGRMGDRLGHRRILVSAAAPFVVGSVLVAGSSGMPLISLGLLLAGGAATAMQIVALGLLQVSFTGGRARVSAFTSFGMIFPAVYLLVPVLTGGFVGFASWRWVPVTWAVLGAVVPLMALRFVPRPPAAAAVGELWTPLLAGLVLAGVVTALQRGHDDGWLSPVTLGWLAVAVVAASACGLAMRRMRTPTFSLRILRVPGMTLLLIGVALIVTASTLTYVMLGLEYLYDQSVLDAALWLVPSQAAAVVGAKLVAGQLMRRWGTARAGVVTLIGFALALLTLVPMSVTAPMALLVVSAALFSLFGYAALTIANAAVMAESPSGQTSMVSAFRGAASALGSALGIVILGAAISAVVIDADTMGVAQVPDPVALADGLRTNGIVGALMAAGAWLVFRWATRPSRTPAS